MVTQFIANKEVREKFNTIFIKPEIDKVLLINNPTDYNTTLLGNAIDYFITCHFNYLKKSETDSFIEEVTVLIERLKEAKVIDTNVGVISIYNRNIYCYFEFLNKEEFDRFIIKTKNIRDDLEKWYSIIRSKRKTVIKACRIDKQKTISFRFLFPTKKISKKRKEESIHWLNELKKIYDSETTIIKYTPEEMGYSCFRDKEGRIFKRRYEGYTKDQTIVTGGEIINCYSNRLFSRLIPPKAAGGEIIYCYSNKEISELLAKSLTQYKEYKVAGKVTDSFLNAILILAQIMPGIRFYKLANNTGTTTENDLNMLKHLIKQIPKSLYEAKNILIQPRLQYDVILGRADYIMDDSIVDIKTTTSFFS